MYDLCVIGGGASGLAAAITAGKNGKKVIIIEKNSKLGRKLYATGNGRCNITNTDLDYDKAGSDYRQVLEKSFNSSYREYTDFLVNSIGNMPYEDTINFVEDIGVVTKNINGYVYPESLQASSFVWALSDAVKKYGVDTLLKTETVSLYKEKDYFIVETNKQNIKTKNLLIACGGKSYKSLGGCDSGYSIARAFGHNIVNVRPALCGLLTLESTEDISGVRAAGKAYLYGDKDRLYAEEAGELQVNDYGVSGIMIYNLSSICGRLIEENQNPYIIIDLLYNRDVDSVVHKIITNGYRTIHGNINAYVNDKLALYILKKNGIDSKQITSELHENSIRKLIDNLKNFRVRIKELKDFENAQVCAGGVDLGEIDNTFQSKKIKGLYFAGEVVDIDGICGGYNISFAILSGIKVGLSI